MLVNPFGCRGRLFKQLCVLIFATKISKNSLSIFIMTNRVVFQRFCFEETLVSIVHP